MRASPSAPPAEVQVRASGDNQRAPVALVVRVDDAGSFRAANRALADALEAGLVRNVSVMAPAPHFAEAAALLRGADVCVGLHVTLTSEWPGVRWGPVASGATTLTGDDGSFHASALAWFERGVDLAHAMREVRAQLSRAREAGLDVRYVDEHMGVGWVHEPSSEHRRLRHELRAWAIREGLLWHEALAVDLPPELLQLQDDAPAFASGIASLAAGRYLWVVHPAHDDGEVHRGTGRGDVARARERDRERVMNPALPSALRSAGVHVARYDEAAGG